MALKLACTHVAVGLPPKHSPISDLDEPQLSDKPLELELIGLEGA